MRRYEVEDVRGDQKIELDLSYDRKSYSLMLNPLAGGMRGNTLKFLERFDSIWIDFGEDSEWLTKDNASKIKRIYLEKGCSDNFLALLYER